MKLFDILEYLPLTYIIRRYLVNPCKMHKQIYRCSSLFCSNRPFVTYDLLIYSQEEHLHVYSDQGVCHGLVFILSLC